MRIVYMGTPRFAVPALEAVASAYDVVGVYTRPDAVSGRGNALRPSPVKEAALARGIPVRQPGSLKDPDEWRVLAGFEPDIVLVAAYGMLLPRDVLDIPSAGCVNIHASLLPRWRGAAPIQRAILSGDHTTGVTIMRMEEGLDAGPYCAQEAVEIGDMDFERLTGALAEAGARLVVPALEGICEGTVSWVDQDPGQATYAAKISKPDTTLEPSLTASQFVRRVRASSPAAPARMRIAGQGMTVLAVQSSTATDLASGAVACSKSGLVLGVSDGAVLATRVKPEGRAAMESTAWICGLRNPDGISWSAP